MSSDSNPKNALTLSDDRDYWLAGLFTFIKKNADGTELNRVYSRFYIHNDNPTSNEIHIAEGNRLLIYTVEGNTLFSSDISKRGTFCFQRYFIDNIRGGTMFSMGGTFDCVSYEPSGDSIRRIKSPDTHPKVRELLVLLFGNCNF